MRAMVLENVCDLSRERAPLRLADVPRPVPGEREVLVRVAACGVCHTELDEIEGRTPPAFFPIIPGHQAVGRVEENGIGAHRFGPGDRVGVAWINSACGTCGFCRSGRENLCASFRATGRDAHGGYAEYLAVHEDFAHPIPSAFSDAEAAPLLCAGAIGYRSLALTGIRDGQTLGLSGFGGSAHLVLKMAAHRFPRTRVLVFARSVSEQAFARELGAAWAGGHDGAPPEACDAIMDTTPAWSPIVLALGNLKPGGRLVINAIRKEDADKDALLCISYPEHLWMEKEVKSVANVTRADVTEFLSLAAEIPIRPEVQLYPLEHANEALMELKDGKVRGSKVLQL
ncbi:MAG: zinc-dependent alcohol dehydrogenase family protein [Deltaproteobacteria bacterium]|nr:zinc-dependent alcohol dehydrogenase family protein [Deltaproteobacteria bacterium]